MDTSESEEVSYEEFEISESGTYFIVEDDLFLGYEDPFVEAILLH